MKIEASLAYVAHWQYSFLFVRELLKSILIRKIVAWIEQHFYKFFKIEVGHNMQYYPF